MTRVLLEEVGSCSALKHFKPNNLLFLEGLDRAKGRDHEDLDSGTKPLSVKEIWFAS